MSQRAKDKMRGFTLIEMVIVVAIIGVLLSIALPNFSEWIRNTQVRNHTEYMQSALQKARAEAIKRNTFVRFQLVTTMAADCVLTTSNNLWVVSHGDPTAACNAAQALETAANDNDPNSGNPVLLIKGFREDQTDFTTALQVIPGTALGGVTPDPVACFNGSGQLARIDTTTGACSASLNPGATTSARIQLDVSYPAGGVCVAAGGPLRCLRLEVSTTGDVRMCDPWINHDSNASFNAADPRACSCDRNATTDQRACA